MTRLILKAKVTPTNFDSIAIVATRKQPATEFESEVTPTNFDSIADRRQPSTQFESAPELRPSDCCS